jgi:hypothetical protein
VVSGAFLHRTTLAFPFFGGFFRCPLGFYLLLLELLSPTRRLRVGLLVIPRRRLRWNSSTHNFTFLILKKFAAFPDAPDSLSKTSFAELTTTIPGGCRQLISSSYQY